MSLTIVADILLSLEVKLAILTFHLILHTLLVIVLIDFFLIRQTLGAEVTVMMTELVRMILAIGYKFRALLAVRACNFKLI